MSQIIEIGQEIKNFVVLEKLGEGGMGSVYKCLDKKLKRNVAIKFLSSDGIDDIKRFQKEAHVLAQLSHPNISVIHEVDYDEKYFFIVMEFLEGKNLKDYLQENSEISVRRYLEIFKDLSSAFAHIHKKGIIHRDIKLTNLFVTTQNQVKIIDFGISKWAEGDHYELTGTNQVIGSPAYLSPEILGEGIVSVQSDIYSFGIAFLNGIMGGSVIGGASLEEVFEKIKFEGVEVPELIKQGVPADFFAFMQYLIEFDPRDRYSAMEDITQELGSLLERLPTSFLNQTVHQITKRKFSSEKQPHKKQKRNKGIKKIESKKRKSPWLALVFTILVFIGIFSIFNRKMEPEVSSDNVSYASLITAVPQAKHPHLYEQLVKLEKLIQEAKSQGLDLPYMYNKFAIDLDQIIQQKKVMKAYQKVLHTNAYLEKKLRDHRAKTLPSEE